MKLPPYGKRLYEFLIAGNVPTNDIYVFTGKWSFNKCEGFKLNKFALCLPKYTCPNDLFWPVEDCDIIVFDDGSSTLDMCEDVVLVLLRDGANIVRLYLFDEQGELKEPMRKYTQ